MKNLFGDNLKWFLEEVVNAEEDQIEDGEIEIYGETESGIEGSATVKLSELCAGALNRIQQLESDNQHYAGELIDALQQGNIDAGIAYEYVERCNTGETYGEVFSKREAAIKNALANKGDQ